MPNPNGALGQWYAKRVAANEIAASDAQLAILPALDDVVTRLDQYVRAPRGFLRPKPGLPRGLYLCGSVGAGKSMLMDGVFALAQTTLKRRVHFHAFMQELHAHVATWRTMSDKERRANPYALRARLDDPIIPFARRVAAQARLLCFDELQVTDIADAMILGRLFQALMAEGTLIFATSNRPPRDLYKDGLNRQLFEPFIHMLEAGMDIISLDTGRDFRRARLDANMRYFSPLDDASHANMAKVWAHYTQGAQGVPVHFDVSGHALYLPRTAAGVAWVDFEDLCAKPYGAKDFLILAEGFDVLLLDNVPMMGPDQRAEAARFRTLIDAFYEAKGLVIMAAAAQPDALYQAGDQSFEFQRTASRLYEMRAADYPEAPSSAP